MIIYIEQEARDMCPDYLDFNLIVTRILKKEEGYAEVLRGVDPCTLTIEYLMNVSQPSSIAQTMNILEFLQYLKKDYDTPMANDYDSMNYGELQAEVRARFPDLKGVYKMKASELKAILRGE